MKQDYGERERQAELQSNNVGMYKCSGVLLMTQSAHCVLFNDIVFSLRCKLPRVVVFILTVP
jgi:hypothetical protein